MTRTADRRAARREARKRRAELRLFGAARTYAAGFDARACAPLLPLPGELDDKDGPSLDELLAELVAAALNYAWVVPLPRRRRRVRRRPGQR
jgi:hypothetical protein